MAELPPPSTVIAVADDNDDEPVFDDDDASSSSDDDDDKDAVSGLTEYGGDADDEPHVSFATEDNKIVSSAGAQEQQEESDVGEQPRVERDYDAVLSVKESRRPLCEGVCCLSERQCT
jgi:hypothetical protein